MIQLDFRGRSRIKKLKNPTRSALRNPTPCDSYSWSLGEICLKKVIVPAGQWWATEQKRTLKLASLRQFLTRSKFRDATKDQAKQLRSMFFLKYLLLFLVLFTTIESDKFIAKLSRMTQASDAIRIVTKNETKQTRHHRNIKHSLLINRALNKQV